MHPNQEKLLKHAEWLRAKGKEYPRTEIYCEILADAMVKMSEEEKHSVQNHHGETVIQVGLIRLLKMLQNEGDVIDNMFMAEMMTDVMLPIP